MNITGEELRKRIGSGESMIVDMYADWCGPCRVLGPIVERFSTKLKEEGSSVSVYKFNIESDRELAAELGVRSIPTIKGFKGGQEMITKVGVLQEAQLREMEQTIL
jgi:thioredoxin 1